MTFSKSVEEAMSEKPPVTNPLVSLKEQNLELLDVIAPKTVEVDFDYLKINDVYFRTLFVAGYPRFVSPGWLEQIVNFNSSLDISFYIYPIEGSGVLDDLRHKIAEMEAEISTDLERGKILNPGTEAALEDARALQEELVKGIEHFFEFAFYVTIRAVSLSQLNQISKQVESTLGALLANAKHAMLDMQDGFLATAPFGIDRLSITRNMDTTSLSTTFPLTSTELSSDQGVLYGINTQNDSFIIFDRFSMENSNMVCFGTSGGGKTIQGDEPVLYKDRTGKVNLDKIESIVEKTIEKGELQKIDEEFEGVIDPKIKVFSFNKNLECEWSEVAVAARKISPKTLYQITTRSGRKIKTTGDHNLVALNEGCIKVTRSDEVKKGTYIPLARKIAEPRNIPNFLLSKKIVPSWTLEMPSGIPTKIPINESLLTLLGLITSEGHAGLDSVSIYNSHPLVLKTIRNSAVKLGFSITPVYKHPNKKIVRGFYIKPNKFALLIHNLGGSGNAATKRVPPLIFSLSNNQAVCYLRAYFEGDGGVDEHHISATTKSKGLASDLSYLLLRFGIIARISKVKKAATNTEAKRKRTYYVLRISGQDNIRKFIKHIGFISKEKNKKAKSLVREGNTNVDVIPELGPIFEEIHDVLYSSSEIPAPRKFSEIKLGIFKPSPQNLLEIIGEIERRIEEIENLEKDGLLTLKSLPTLADIIETGSQRQKNALLWKTLNKSWWTMKRGWEPYLFNTLKAVKITHGLDYSPNEISQSVYKSFKTTGESLRTHDSSLWDSVVLGNRNPQYQRLLKARDYISEKYEEKKIRFSAIKQKVAWLKTLANSDLFWDPIVKVEKVKSKHKYVYDLQVDNGVFLAGHAGMFVHNSYLIKLESVRSLMLGSEIIIIDPEAEYKALADAVGGQNISFSFASPSKINPFDLSQVYEPGESQLGLKILSLHSLFKIIMGSITPTQEALLDRALIASYRGKGITQDPATQTKEPPLMEDLYKTLIGIETPDAMDLAARIEKFVKGSFVGILDQHTNIDIENPFTVFSIKELEDALRPIAMFVILDFIWTRIKRELKRRLLVVDEAWHMMRYVDSAQFLWSIVKRARKYYLGLTTITQDVEDFLAQDIGKAIVTNSALRVLLKQSPAAIDRIAEVFYLSQGEKQLLLGANIGEGIFFAGSNHAPINVVASPEEHKLVTTKPQELLEMAKGISPGDVAKITQQTVEGRRK